MKDFFTSTDLGSSLSLDLALSSPPKKLRHILLETLHRLYPSEAARPFASSLMTCMLEVVRSDNEENAVQALKIIIDLHRTHKAVLEEHVQPFLNLVQTLYTNMKDTVKEAFGEAKEGGTTGQVSFLWLRDWFDRFRPTLPPLIESVLTLSLALFLVYFLNPRSYSLPTLPWQPLLQLENQLLVVKVL